jgi:hypothetical protein
MGTFVDTSSNNTDTPCGAACDTDNEDSTVLATTLLVSGVICGILGIIVLFLWVKIARHNNQIRNDAPR